MNMTEMKNSIARLGREIHDDAAKLAAMAMDDMQKDEDVAKQRGALDAKVARLNALQTAYNAQMGESTGNLQPTGDPAQERTRSELLKSREYARAFAHGPGSNPPPRRTAWRACFVPARRLRSGGP